MKPDALNKTSGGPPSLELPTFRRATISAHGIPHGRFLRKQQSRPGDMRGAGGRLARGEEHSPQSVQPASHRPRPLPSARPVTPLEPLCPPEKTQDPENAFNSETHQPGSQATQQLSRGRNSLVIRTRGKEGKCSRKRNKTEISSVLERTACWVTPP